MKQSRLYPGASPTPPMAVTTVTFAVGAAENPVTARARSVMLGFPVGCPMYVTAADNKYIPR